MNERRREALIIVLHNRTEFLRVVLANRDRELFLRSAGEKRGRKGKDRGERVAVNLRGRDCTEFSAKRNRYRRFPGRKRRESRRNKCGPIMKILLVLRRHDI